MAELATLPVEEHTLLAARNAKLLLDYGFTAVVGAAAAKPRLDIVIRNEINAGQIPGGRRAGTDGSGHCSARGGSTFN